MEYGSGKLAHSYNSLPLAEQSRTYDNSNDKTKCEKGKLPGSFKSFYKRIVIQYFHDKVILSLNISYRKSKIDQLPIINSILIRDFEKMTINFIKPKILNKINCF
ncbi:hypothetical protein VUJ46_11675 [Chryseobacterium sp. MYb264]|uniref:hypothetical protein n=1 Tax=Chryseobacterium sp. MYb264 TaxID=2745153 RepID=UPI002E15F6C2|nr:hypothetical protein VUJ46_11675 [Chryseobacterium sp. MYb264]